MKHRTTALLGALVATLLVLSGCAPTPTESTPTGEEVAPELQRFYEQKLVWKKCGTSGKTQCADATAPLDWNSPTGETITLALSRRLATGTKQGSLLVNPGGPGASGYQFVLDSADFAVSAEARKHFDVVGFDPRGVNRSSAVSCADTPEELTEALYDLAPYPTGSEEWIDAQEAASAEFGQACLTHTGPLLQFVDTVSAARDLDLLRAILGDTALNYLGYSYGTFLGATYADLYPEKTGRLVLDGALDPATTEFEVTSVQAQGFESALRAYLADCITGTECPFRGTVDDAMNDIGTLLSEVDRSPLRAKDGRQLGSGALLTAIILPLYSTSMWGYLGELFTSVTAGDPEIAFSLADSYYGRLPDGSFEDNSTEAFTAINCLDYSSTTTREQLHQEAAQLAEMAPTFGPWMSYGGTSCQQWPYPSTRERAPITASGSAPILVVGTTNDPATPYRWAENLAGQLENGHLVTYQGEGHTAYNKTNSCINKAVDTYLIHGTVPDADPKC